MTEISSIESFRTLSVLDREWITPVAGATDGLSAQAAAPQVNGIDFSMAGLGAFTSGSGGDDWFRSPMAGGQIDGGAGVDRVTIGDRLDAGARFANVEVLDGAISVIAAGADIDLSDFEVNAMTGALFLSEAGAGSRVIGTQDDDWFYGPTGGDRIDGASGADTVTLGRMLEDGMTFANVEILDGGATRIAAGALVDLSDFEVNALTGTITLTALGAASDVTGTQDDDTFYGPTAGDRIDGAAGTDTVTLSTILDDGMTFENVEILGGSFAFMRSAGQVDLSDFETNQMAGAIYGSGFGDTIIGTQDADQINARGGDDSVYLGANDTVDGGSGFDTLLYDADRFFLSDEGTGSGTLRARADSAVVGRYSGFEAYDGQSVSEVNSMAWREGRLMDPADAFFDDAFAFEDAFDAPQAALTFVEKQVDAFGNLVGTFADDIIGTEDSGGFVFTMDGNDVFTGGVGNDNVYGGAGDDRLKGGEGFDLLDGGAGRDVLNGGAGIDVFVFRQGQGTTIIEDFELSYDILDIEGFTDLTYDALTLAGRQIGADVHYTLGEDLLILQNTTLATMVEIDLCIR